MKNSIFFFICLMGFTVSSAQHQLVIKWETEPNLKVPESVLLDDKNKILYVSNIDGAPWAKDGKGSIGKIGLDGKIIVTDWITGLNAPKGMGLYKNKLYVADVDKVIVIDLSKAVIIQNIPIIGAIALNDITIDKKGVVYVSDSKTKKIHQLIDGKVSLLLENLKWPNGLLMHKKDFYVLDNGSLYQMDKSKKLTLIADGMEGGTDGVVNVEVADFIVSCWDGVIWYVKGDGSKELLLDTKEQKINTADIAYDAKNKIVYVPTFWKNSVIAYQLSFKTPGNPAKL
ncbi:hypothetical protein [Flavobacterium sp. ZB4P13]|uniref:hypothetical protein n=1 Tax=Flavobacterium sp. ZB4P13 TaxID=3401728 RepID=UPI003AAA5993